MNDIKEYFPSMSALVATLKAREENKVFAGRACHSLSVSKDTISFTQTQNMREAYDLLLNGWGQHIDEFKAKIAQAAKQAKKTKTGVVGFAPHVPNAIKGVPNSMIYRAKVKRPAPCVDVLYSVRVPGYTSTAEIITAGAAVISYLQALEASGTRVRLTALLKTNAKKMSGGQNIQMGVKLKDYQEPFSLKKLCFPIVHPSALRRIGFRWLETVPGLEDTSYLGGYGGPSKLETIKKLAPTSGTKIIRAEDLINFSDMPEEMRKYIEAALA